MPSNFTSTVTFEVKPDVPQGSLKFDESVDAFDKCHQLELRVNETKTIELQPANNAEQIHFLVIWRQPPADPKLPKPDPMKLTYQLNGEGDEIPLDNQHVIMGYGVFKLIKCVPKTLKFTNKQDNPVVISLMVGRDQPKYPVSAPPPGTPAGVPPGTPLGTSPTTTSGTNLGTATAPSVTSFTPTSGPGGASGELVTITGSGFTDATGVGFNATPVTNFHVVSDTVICANVPDGATTGKISVTTPAGTGQSSGDFTVT